VQLTANLSTSKGALSGATVDLQYKASTASSWTSSSPAVTNDSGDAVFTVSGLSYGVLYDFQGSFQGTAMFGASQQEITFDESSPLSQTSVSVSTTPPVVSGTSLSTTVTGTLTSGGKGLSGAVLDVYVDGTEIGSTSPTDSGGTFSFDLTDLPVAMHKLKVTFAGTTLYDPSSATASFGIAASGVGAGGILAVAAIVVAVGGFALYRRRPRRR